MSLITSLDGPKTSSFVVGAQKQIQFGVDYMVLATQSPER